MLFALVLPHVWIAMAALAYVVFRARRRLDAPSHRWSELVLLALGPLAIVLWGALLWGTLEYGTSSPLRWQDNGLYVLFAAEAIVALWLVHRHRARLTAAAVCAVLAILWSGGALIIASMAVTNDWL